MGVLSGKSVVVTGAGNGLGKAYAVDIARLGGAVVVNDVDVSAANMTVEEIQASGGRAVVSHASVGEWYAAASIIATAVDSFGRLDGLVNNAGVVPYGVFWEETEERIKVAIDTNLMGGIFCGIHATQAMLASGGRGSIVNIISATQMGYPSLSIYGATKGGIASLTYCQASDLAGTMIRVNAVAPNARTKPSDDYDLHMTGALPNPGFSAESNAPLVSYLLSDLSAGITGQAISIRGSQVAILNHPSVSSYVVERSHWTVGDLAEVFDSSLREGLQPYTAGVVAGTQYTAE